MYSDCSARPAQPDVLKTRVLSKALCPLFSFFPPRLHRFSTVFAFFFLKKKRKTEGEKKSENLLSFFFFSIGLDKRKNKHARTYNRCYSFDTLIDEYFFSFFMIFEDREIVKRKFQEFGQVVILKCVD